MNDCPRLPPISYRRAVETDMRFVVESFLDSYRTAHQAGLIAMEDWNAVMEPQWRKALARPHVEVFVAGHPDGDPDHHADIYAWAAIERGFPPFVLYVYCKQAYRRMGIATWLLGFAGIRPQDPFEYACRTAIVARIHRAMPRATFNPLRARFPPRPVGEESHDEA